MTETKGHGPGVRFPPPLVFVAGLVLGWIVDRYLFHLWPTLSSPAVSGAERVGIVFIGAGLGLIFWGIITFNRAETAVFPNHDASRLVVAGPYKYTRNPMYSGMSAAYIGVALLIPSGWAFVMLPFVLLTLYRLVISREERYLTEAFGDQYRQYQARVGRWF